MAVTLTRFLTEVLIEEVAEEVCADTETLFLNEPAIADVLLPVDAETETVTFCPIVTDIAETEAAV